MKYRSKQGDVLDAVCFEHYGREGLTEFVLQENHGLADHGAVLPSGILIQLPDAPPPKPTLQSLFD